MKQQTSATAAPYHCVSGATASLPDRAFELLYDGQLTTAVTYPDSAQKCAVGTSMHCSW